MFNAHTKIPSVIYLKVSLSLYTDIKNIATG